MFCFKKAIMIFEEGNDDMLELTLQIIVIAGCADLAYAIYEKRKKDGEMEDEDI